MGHLSRLNALKEYIEGLKRGQVGTPKEKQANRIKQINKFKKRR